MADSRYSLAGQREIYWRNGVTALSVVADRLYKLAAKLELSGLLKGHKRSRQSMRQHLIGL